MTNFNTHTPKKDAIALGEREILMYIHTTEQKRVKLCI